MNCRCQVGGSDQWGNIASGIDLVRRLSGHQVFGATVPLLVDSQGQKYGKSSDTGAIWLDPNLTTPYQFYQFFMNIPDQEVEALLKRLTFLPLTEIETIMNQHNELPDNRLAQKTLASTLTEMVHGKKALRSALSNTTAFFGFNWT